MATYETVLVIHPRLSDPEVADFAEKTKLMITKGGGEILNEDRWGRRKLAYPIDKAREGFYLYIKFSAEGPLVNKMSQHFRIQENILRALTVHAQESKPAEPAKERKEDKVQAPQ